MLIEEPVRADRTVWWKWGFTTMWCCFLLYLSWGFIPNVVLQRAARNTPWMLSRCSIVSEVSFCLNFFCYQIIPLKWFDIHLFLLRPCALPCAYRRTGCPLILLTPMLVLINQRKPQLNRISDSLEKWTIWSPMCKQSHENSAHANVHAESSLTPRSLGWRNARVNHRESCGN